MINNVFSAFRNRYIFPTEHMQGKCQATHLQMRERRIQIVWTCLFMFLLNLAFFLVLWFVSLVNSGGDFSLTFSEMLLVTADNRELFLSWYVWYVFMTLIFLTYTILWEDIDIVDNRESDAEVPMPCFRKRKTVFVVYFIFTMSFACFSVIKLIFLILLFAFPDTGDTETTHLWVASVAYVSAILSCFSLYIRRMFVRRQPFIHRSIFLIFFFNTLLIAAQWALALTFLLTWKGEVEFTLTLLIVLDPIFQVIDHRNHTLCFTTLHNDVLHGITAKKPMETPEEGGKTDLSIETKPFINRENITAFLKPIPIESSAW